MQLPAENEGGNCWFAIRVSYSRELALKAILDAENIENFIPMRYEYIMKSGKRVRKLLPAIHNLVFVYSTRKRIDTLKDRLESSMPIRFIMNREHCRPVVIPESQMRSFILVAGNCDEAVLYVEPAELHLVKGQKVRITGGVFEGVIGEFRPTELSYRPHRFSLFPVPHLSRSYGSSHVLGSFSKSLPC